MNFTRLSKLSNLVTDELKRKPTVILEPNPGQSIRMSGVANDLSLNIDVDRWIVPKDLQPFITNLSRKKGEIEEKILKLYVKLCEDYTYDDNVLSYIQKNDDDTFFLPDDYGRSTDDSWKKNRELHKRRNCFEISRILAKSIKSLLKQSHCAGNFDVCILWDEAVTHYFVGVVNNEYCISLDLDDFTQIKDLTRVKTGLTVEGIKILDDPAYKFSSTLKKFNDGRCKIAKKHIEEKIENETTYKDNETLDDIDNIESEDIQFLKNTIQILKEDYNLDSAGIFEYLKEIIDTKISPRSRKKVWKEVQTTPGTGKRYSRCLVVTIDDNQYLVDVTEENINQMFRLFDIEEMKGPNAKVKPFNIERNWEDDPYDGR